MAAGSPQPAGGVVADNMSDDERKRLQMGQGAYSMLVLFTTVAFISGLYANAYCDFAGREINFVPGFNVSAACDSLGLDPSEQGICTTFFTDTGVGFYGWYATVPVNQQVCLSYTLWNPYINGWITPDFDSSFTAAAVFAVMANCFGAVAWFTFMMSSCCLLTQERLYGMSGTFFLACLFQGLSMLVFASNVCELEFLLQYFPNAPADFVNNIESVQCVQGTGSRMAIVATVFYFLCMNLTPKAIAPMPIRYRGPAAAPPIYNDAEAAQNHVATAASEHDEA